MHVAFVEPSFPNNQREFLRGLLSTGARVSAISERPIEALPRDLREGLCEFERVRSVVDEHALAEAVKRLSQRVKVDRLEATVEAHVMAAAHVRERLDIHGTTSKTAWLCRDKPEMKAAARAAGPARDRAGREAERGDRVALEARLAASPPRYAPDRGEGGEERETSLLWQGVVWS